MSQNTITVIVATYNRPLMLEQALISVINQTYTSWTCLVIGDCCDGRTGDVIKKLDHPSIKYYNNPNRFGEQSGGNSIGLALADTEFVAYLNHDDIWTPDHLEKGIKCMAKGKVDFYISRAIFTKRLDESGMPILKNCHPRKRKPYKAFYKYHLYIEPVSSWILKTAAAEKVGNWSLRSQITRYPINDFFNRCVKAQLKIHFSENITCIAGIFHHVTTAAIPYDHPGNEFKILNDHYKSMLEENKSNFIQEASLRESDFKSRLTQNGKIRWDWFLNLILANPITATFYKFTGIDTYEFFRKGITRTKSNKINVSKRTGETHAIIQGDIEQAIEVAKNKI